MSSALRPYPKPAPRQPRGKKPVPRVNPERKAKRFEAAYGAKGSWIREQRCVCTGRCTGEWVKDSRIGQVQVVVVAAHATSRGAGGDSRDLIPLASHLHAWAHGPGGSHPALGRRFGLNLKELAKDFETRWQQIVARAKQVSGR